MRLITLLETVDSDQIKHDKAEQIISVLFSYLKKASNEYDSEKYFTITQNEKAFGIFSNQIPDMPKFAHDLIFQFSSAGGDSYGKFLDLRRRNMSAKFGIILYLGHDIENIWEDFRWTLDCIVEAAAFKETLFHELIHYLDFQEHTTSSSNNSSNNTAADGSDLEKYFNNRWEQNAFFMMLSEPLLKIRNALNSNDEHTALQLAKTIGLSDNFEAVVRNILNSRPDATKSQLVNAMTYLKTPKYKRYVTRLYKIYDDIKTSIIQRYQQSTDAVTEANEYFGSAGAGCVIMARDTGRILMPLRSNHPPPHHVNEPGTYGTWGGKIDDGENPEKAARREVEEECGHNGDIQMIPLYVYKDGSFRYYNYLAIVPDEFKPQLNWETESATWTTLDKLPGPLHPGLRKLLADAPSYEIIKSYAEKFSQTDQNIHEGTDRRLTIYRGEYSGNKGGNFWTTDKEWARQFTQSGRDQEIKTRFIYPGDIYKKSADVYAGNPDAVDAAIDAAKAEGYKAVMLDEGPREPKSIYIFDKTALIY